MRGKAVQADLLADEQGQEYNPTETINGIRSAVESWRNLPQAVWAATVTPTAAQLLNHWRSHPFANQKPFFLSTSASRNRHSVALSGVRLLQGKDAETPERHPIQQRLFKLPVRQAIVICCPTSLLPR